MSDYQPKVGDRVRVVLEGEVGFAYDDGCFYIASTYVHGPEGHVVSVEQIAPPLPTTPESVIFNTILKEIRVLGSDGRWRDSDGDAVSLIKRSHYEVIFDAGAAK